ncbi:MAG: class I SAM-dependent methyltransferase [Paracoccaceae bacterium]
MPQTVTPLTIAATKGLMRLLDGPPSADRLAAALRHLAKWRSAVLDNTLVATSGTTVLHGPFQGMAYPVRAAEGARAARLIGGYEASLAPVIQTIIDRAYATVIDIGCAEGYYAVGLARRMPLTLVLARDISLPAQALCRQLAQANDVADRVEIGGQFNHADFDLCVSSRSVVICDIEGAEGDLLDPAAAPGLTQADILVEVHEGMRPGLIATLTDRFSPTHTVTRIDRALRPDLLPAWAERLSDLDRLLLLWEWRASPTPWLWIDRK